MRTILEYRAISWDPSKSCGMNQVQCKFLNFAAYILKIDHQANDTSG